MDIKTKTAFRAVCLLLAVSMLSGCVESLTDESITLASHEESPFVGTGNTSADDLLIGSIVIDDDDDPFLPKSSSADELPVPGTEDAAQTEPTAAAETTEDPAWTETSIIPEKTVSSSAETTAPPPPVTEAPVTQSAATEAVTTEAAAARELSDSYDPAYFANDLFIGDSIYTGISAYGYFSKDKVFAQVGLNPSSARTKAIGGYTAAQKAAAMKPKRIFIMLGTNGIAFLSAAYMTEQMQQLVGELQAASPDSHIYVVAIPPVTKVHDAAGQETLEAVTDYNANLKKMCADNGISFLDLCSILKGSDGFFSLDYAEADGLHFLGRTYRFMFAFFQENTQ